MKTSLLSIEWQLAILGLRTWEGVETNCWWMNYKWCILPSEWAKNIFLIFEALIQEMWVRGFAFYLIWVILYDSSETLALEESSPDVLLKAYIFDRLLAPQLTNFYEYLHNLLPLNRQIFVGYHDNDVSHFFHSRKIDKRWFHIGSS